VLVSSCLASEQEECAMRTGEEAGYKCCEAQKLQYTLLSSVALFAADGVMILYGEYSDRAGPRACFTVGTALAWSGLGTIALNSLWGLDWLWYVAFFLVGISGPGVFMGVLFLAEKHPELRAIVTSLTASMWDSSSIVFLIFHAAYFNLGISLHSVTLFWLALCVLSGVHSWFTLPSLEGVSRIRAAHAASEGDGDGGIELTRGESEFEPTAELIEAPAGGLLSQLIRADTLLMYAFMAVYNLKSTFFITTFADQMLQLFPPETHGKTAESLALTFDTAFPVGGLLTSAVASVLLEKLGDREDLYMALVLTITIVFGIANLLPFVFTQYVAALLFGPARTIQWACYFHFLGLPSRYSPQFVGRLLGYGNLVIAAVGDVPPCASRAIFHPHSHPHPYPHSHRHSYRHSRPHSHPDSHPHARAARPRFG